MMSPPAFALALDLAFGLPPAAPSLAYVGPGAGIALAGSLALVLLAIVLGGAGVLLSPILGLRRWVRLRAARARRRVRTAAWEGEGGAGGGPRRVVLIGLDGLDPGLLDRWIRAGHLPTFARLGERGHRGPIRTTFPAISPAAWTTVATGVRPSKHGIFDFIRLDRPRYAPTLAGFEVAPRPRRGPLAGIRERLLGPRQHVATSRRATPFWQTLGQAGVPTAILRVPMTYPPEPIPLGRLLSGMSLPDLRGSQGTYTLLSTALPDDKHATDSSADSHSSAGPTSTTSTGASGGAVRLPLRFNKRARGARDRAVVDVPGPLPVSASGVPTSAQQAAMCRLTITKHARDPDRIRLAIAGGRTITLLRGHASRWLTLPFTVPRVATSKRARRWARAAGIRTRITGITRATYLETSGPDEPGEVAIYLTPIMIDPLRPATPITHPTGFAPFLAGTQGPFATLGLAEDTWALDDGVLDTNAFLAQCAAIRQERIRMLHDALTHTREGVVMVVFDETDRVQHMCWRELDEARASAPDDPAAGIDTPIGKLYQAYDALLADTLPRLRDDDLLLVMSDHGFTSFAREVDLNAWLLREGYLVLHDEAAAAHAKGEATEDWLRAIDPTRTRAFALGLGGIWLNVEGRDTAGLVPPSEAAALAREISQKLITWTDDTPPALLAAYPPPDPAHEADGRIRPVARAEPVMSTAPGPYAEAGPDILVGTRPGYRVAWSSVRGGLGKGIVRDNPRRWAGDHGVDPRAVPGVLLVNAALGHVPGTPDPALSPNARPAQRRLPHLADIAPTILAVFGCDRPGNSDGTALPIGALVPPRSIDG